MAKAKKPSSPPASEGYTGRYLVMLPEEGSTQAHLEALQESTGMQVTRSSEFKDSVITSQDFEQNDAIYLEELGVAVLNANPQQVRSLSGPGIQDSPYLIEPERIVHTFGASEEYLQGFKDAVDALARKFLTDQNGHDDQEEPAENGFDAQVNGATWGLTQTGVVHSPLFREYSGKGIKVAVLDTGFDTQHPDFAGRNVVTASFITGQTVQDGHGHGTHCIGTACGPKSPAGNIPRYGIAYESTIFAGKVLANSGSGSDGGILAGINWALANKCEIISMSLGARVTAPGFSQIFETVALKCLNNGTLIVAAAGNDSSRPSVLIPVSHPANCPSILAVGAVDINGKVARFSNRGIHTPYGSVNIAGPGVGVFSSTKLPTKYATWNGTSMATPHVAGIAALWAQRSAANRGTALWNRLVSMAKALSEPSADVGSGLVQAPLVRLPIMMPLPTSEAQPTFQSAGAAVPEPADSETVPSN